jgi:hypothetical protein
LRLSVQAWRICLGSYEVAIAWFEVAMGNAYKSRLQTFVVVYTIRMY